MWKQIENLLINYMYAHRITKNYDAKNVQKGKLKQTKMSHATFTFTCNIHVQHSRAMFMCNSGRRSTFPGNS